MTTTCTTRYAIGPGEYAGFNTRELQENFLVTGLFKDDQVNLVYSHYDRFIAGGAKPVNGALSLDTVDELKAAYFLERRELGIINVGGSGLVTIDGESIPVDYKESLYVGQGSQQVSFKSDDPAKPALFYLNSAPAHKSFPTRKIGLDDADVMQMGEFRQSNQRRINKLIVNSILETCQLQMGMTELQEGSIWNTMPAHTHSRRMETYFYFEVPDDQAVCHFMGPKDETRHLWVLNNQAVLSPPWSIHSGAGTSNYIFIWGMAGENLDYSDMDTIHPNEFGLAES